MFCNKVHPSAASYTWLQRLGGSECRLTLFFFISICPEHLCLLSDVRIIGLLLALAIAPSQSLLPFLCAADPGGRVLPAPRDSPPDPGRQRCVHAGPDHRQGAQLGLQTQTASARTGGAHHCKPPAN